MELFKARGVTSQELHILVSEFSSHIAHVVEVSADEIMSRTTDPTTRRRALVWKIYAISECQSAATSSEPLIAFINMWVFILQMADYLETGGGEDAFGELQPIAVNTSRSLEAQITNMIKEVSMPEGFDKTQSLVDDWVREHPIKNQFYTRDSTLPLIGDIYMEDKKGAFATVNNIDQEIRDVYERILFLADNLPRQVRWQAEYFMETTVSGEKLEETLNNVNVLIKSVDRMARVVEQSPELIDKERTAVSSGIREERKAVLKSINEQRIETVQELNNTVEDISKRMEGLVESLFWRVSICLSVLVGAGLAVIIWMKARSKE